MPKKITTKKKLTKKKSAKKKMSENFEIPEILPPKVDIVFKMLFGDERNKDVLIAFLEAVLDVKISDVSLLDSVIKRRSKEDKMGILDVKAKLAKGEIINIEIQSKTFKYMRNRITFYSDSIVVEQIKKGNDYSVIKPVHSITITQKSIIHESKKCHNIFSMLEEEEGFEFNGLKKIHILDLSRIDREKNENVSDWLKFINAEKEEDFMPLVKKRPIFKKAFGELKVMSADEEKRMLYNARLKHEWDVASLTKDAREDGMQAKAETIAKKMLAKGADVDYVVDVTGLDLNDVLKLKGEV